MAAFTPRVNGKRVRMDVSPGDMKKITKGRGVKGVVVDRNTGKAYRVYGASCGEPRCYCDATAHLVTKKTKKA